MDVIRQYDTITSWSESEEDQVEELEDGKVLFFPQLAFDLDPKEKELLDAKYLKDGVKNISYDPKKKLVKGTVDKEGDFDRLLERYSSVSTRLVSALAQVYGNNIEIGKTSFRPVEVKGRQSSYKKDDTRLHIDAFPSNPLGGKRILRVFSNVNPYNEDRVWRVGEPFENLAKRYLSYLKRPLVGSALLLKLLGITKSVRTSYDHYMLALHDIMKNDEKYQKEVEQATVKFPPGSTWMTFTDSVSHAAMMGRFVLEQTFYLPVHSMVDPKKSPLMILEELVGRDLVEGIR